MMKLANKDYINKITELRMKRKQLRLTIDEVAKYIGISRSAISQFEAYRATLSDLTISKYEEFLNERM